VDKSPNAEVTSGGRETQRIKRKMSLEVIAGVVVVLVVALSPLINALYGQSFQGLAIVALGGLAGIVIIQGRALTKAGKWICAISVAISLGAAAIDNSDSSVTRHAAKLLSVLIAMLAATTFAREHTKAYRRTLSVLLAGQLCVSLVQLIGIAPWAYSYVDYANAAEPVPLLSTSLAVPEDPSISFLPQKRPSGLSPAPTYLSFFLILAWFALVTPRHCSGKVTPLMFGALSVISGATAGLVLTFVALLLHPKRSNNLWLAIGAIATGYLLWRITPSLVEANYLGDDFLRSVDQRIGQQEDGGAESILQTRPWLLLSVAVAAIAAYPVLLKSNPWRDTLRAGTAILLPLLIHDANATFYWMLVGLSLDALGIRLLTERRRGVHRDRRS
jgi:hypothetical protein